MSFGTQRNPRGGRTLRDGSNGRYGRRRFEKSRQLEEDVKDNGEDQKESTEGSVSSTAVESSSATVTSAAVETSSAASPESETSTTLPSTTAIPVSVTSTSVDLPSSTSTSIVESSSVVTSIASQTTSKSAVAVKPAPSVQPVPVAGPTGQPAAANAFVPAAAADVSVPAAAASVFVPAAAVSASAPAATVASGPPPPASPASNGSANAPPVGPSQPLSTSTLLPSEDSGAVAGQTLGLSTTIPTDVSATATPPSPVRVVATSSDIFSILPSGSLSASNSLPTNIAGQATAPSTTDGQQPGETSAAVPPTNASGSIQDQSGASGKKAPIGMIVGLTLGLLVLGVLAFWFIRRHRRGRASMMLPVHWVTEPAANSPAGGRALSDSMIFTPMDEKGAFTPFVAVTEDVNSSVQTAPIRQPIPVPFLAPIEENGAFTPFVAEKVYPSVQLTSDRESIPNILVFTPMPEGTTFKPESENQPTQVLKNPAIERLQVEKRNSETASISSPNGSKLQPDYLHLITDGWKA